MIGYFRSAEENSSALWRAAGAPWDEQLLSRRTKHDMFFLVLRVDKSSKF